MRQLLEKPCTLRCGNWVPRRTWYCTDCLERAERTAARVNRDRRAASLSLSEARGRALSHQSKLAEDAR